MDGGDLPLYPHRAENWLVRNNPSGIVGQAALAGVDIRGVVRNVESICCRFQEVVVASNPAHGTATDPRIKRRGYECRTLSREGRQVMIA